ncbi:MAG TPA: glycine--tRNA ligase subunit beta [Bryobacteraceae bacterium]|nr:glycine--tRNA ligase subunit beta [Bryobacteraceae bacterium]
MNLLLEIGCEEIPDWMLAGALEYLGSAIGDLTKNLRNGNSPIRTDATPRRLVIRAEGLIARQPDSEERVWGPAKSAPAPAVAGFAKKQGVAPDQLEILSDGKAEKYSYVRKIAGRATTDILAEALPQLILKTPFPKTMLWPGKGGARFIRPIRWVVALLDNQVIPFEIADVKSGNESGGHRRLGKYRFPVTYENFEERLRENYVILSAKERRERITGYATKFKRDDDLLEVLVNLTEWPTPITGNFDPSFLDLPGEVLTTVMKVHQKNFSVEAGNGKLAPQFVAVTNTDGDPDGLIQHGNENVVRARFNDARFFWNADQKRPLAERVHDLANVTFQAKLGSYLAKTERVAVLVAELGGDAHAQRAALLSKTDLTTELVKEFTELQGIIGGLYAKAQGESEEVATAIYDHYKPLSMEDSIPRTKAGQLVAIADKLDSLRGCFSVGIIPSGSKDPFALRRAAQGIVKIIIEGKLRLPARQLLGQNEALREFFFDRVRYYFREIRGFKYDEINAVLAAGSDDLIDIEERLTALQQVRPTADFEPLAAAFKRISNILRQSEWATKASPNTNLLEDGPEAGLHANFLGISAQVRDLADYKSRLERIATLRPSVDLFFDKVMVNVDNPEVRHNRLALLHSVLTEFSTIADFSEIVTTSQENK